MSHKKNEHICCKSLIKFGLLGLLCCAVAGCNCMNFGYGTLSSPDEGVNFKILNVQESKMFIGVSEFGPNFKSGTHLYGLSVLIFGSQSPITVNGMMICGLESLLELNHDANSYVNGMMISINGAAEKLNGVAINALTGNIFSGSGLMISSLVNYSKPSGNWLSQIGLINVNGVFQVGLINVTRTGGLQIGLINYDSNALIPFFPGLNYSTPELPPSTTTTTEVSGSHEPDKLIEYITL